jgi:hypothetical protein
MGRRSGRGREKRVTLEFGEYRRRKNSTPKFRALHVTDLVAGDLLGIPGILL